MQKKQNWREKTVRLEIERQLRDLTMRLAAMESQAVALGNRIDTVESDVVVVEGDIVNIEGDLVDIDARITVLESPL